MYRRQCVEDNASQHHDACHDDAVSQHCANPSLIGLHAQILYAALLNSSTAALHVYPIMYRLQLSLINPLEAASTACTAAGSTLS